MVNFKYIKLINYQWYPSKGYEPEKICLIFEIGGNTPKSHRILMKITPSDSAYRENPTMDRFQAPMHSKM